MLFNSAADTNISRALFSDVGHDQINISGSVEVSYHYHVYPVSAEEHDNRRPSSHSPLQDRSETSPRNIVLRPTFRSQTAAGDARRLTAARLIVEIVQSLMTLATPDQFRDLKEDLNTLQQTLDLTGLAIEAYQCASLGRMLAKRMGEAMEQCIRVLHDLLSTIRGYQHDLRSSRTFLALGRWSESGRKFADIRIWREKLFACQKSLGECLQVLDSAPWEAFGSSVCAKNISPEDVIRLLGLGPPSLRHLQVNKIIVIDHLGQNIPVPTIFCSSWENFSVFISGLCKDRAGHEFIERGDFRMLRDNKFIDPLEFPDHVASGMTMEMSIALRQRASVIRSKKCPRCGYINNTSVTDNGWIDRHCSGQYQISENEEDIVSPASTRRNPQLPDDEESIRYFRRIHVFKLRTGWVSEPLSNDPLTSGIFSTHNFIQSVASSLDEFDPGIFRPDGDINFERDFGDWFRNPRDEMGGELDAMK